MLKKSFVCAALAFAVFSADAQLKTPAPSPSQTIKQDFGISTVEVSYSRPAVKSRTVFGDLVPYNKLWRTGANASTKIKFGDDVIIGGQKVKAGEYSIYTIPGQNEWEVIFNKSLTNWGVDGYKKEEDVARIKVKPIALNRQVESFTIQFNDITSSSMNLYMAWDKTAVEVPIQSEVVEKVMAQIDKLMNADTRPYYAAAMFYIENGKDLDQAIKWLDKATEQNPKAFWMLYQKANALAKTGKKKEAIEAAKKSMEIAKEAKNDDYVRLNEKLIESLK